MLLEDIIWHRHQTLCSVSHRGSQSRYHINSTFFNKARTSLPICVPVPLLVLESDWPLPPISPMYTLYGCPRLTRGPQVRCSLNFNAVSVHLVDRWHTHPCLTRHLQACVTITSTVLATHILYELATIGTANLQKFIPTSFLISEFGSLS